MVVRDRKLPQPATMTMTPLDSGEPALDTSGLSEREYTVLRTFLARRSSLDPAARRQLAASLAATLRRQIGDLTQTHADPDDETLIQAAVSSYRSRYASGTDET